MLAAVLGGRQQALTVRPRRLEERNVLRVAFTAALLPDPHRRVFPLSQYNLLILSLWEPLVECDPATSLPQPAAARSWAWSPDRLTLTLQLRPDARWSNGDPVTAHDFVRGWHRLLQENKTMAWTLAPLKNAEAFLRGQLTDLQAVGVQARDDLTLQLDLAKPRSTLVAELADPLLSPLHRTAEEILRTKSHQGTAPDLVTNGPFRLVQASPDGFSLEASKYYHGREGVKLAGVHFIRADSASIATLLVAAGVVDLFAPTPYGPARDKPTERPVTLESELVLSVSALDFNTSRGPLRDVRVRQALALALDRRGPIRKFNPGRMEPAWSWVPGMPGREGLVLLKEDAAEARRLLAAAGYPGGKGFPVLRLALPLWMEDDPYPVMWSERWFQELGVRTYLAYESLANWEARARVGDYDLMYGRLLATVPDAGALLDYFMPPVEFSGPKWVDPGVTALLNEADTLSGPQRLAVLEKVERTIMAAVPSVPMMFERRQIMRADEVRGWYVDPLARQSPKRLWLDLPSLRDPNAVYDR
jgi:oligopeptide transport system substrate-binding protein